MKYFLSCDWGTTSLRVRLVDIKQGKVLLEEVSSAGISDTFNLWNRTQLSDEQQKVHFYLAVIDNAISKLERRLKSSLGGIKVIISGMASSSAGFINIPYADVPLPVDGSGFKTALIKANNQFNHNCLVISGVKTPGDVMRGEETQLIGCIGKHAIKNELFIFPGTHSKHIRVKDNLLAEFKTYMTGEFFELLSKKSILKNSIALTSTLKAENLQSFKLGVGEAASGNLLHAAFNVRINDLFEKLNGEENFAYLSGLIIGTELKDLVADNGDAINLISSPGLAPWYCAALDELGIKYTYSPGVAETATVQGHIKIGRKLKFIS